MDALVYFFFRSKVMDVVKLAQAEKEHARKEKEFFSVVMDSASSLVIVLEVDGRIVLANNTCGRYLSNDVDTIEGRSLWDFFSISCENILLQDLLNTNNKTTNTNPPARLKNNNCISICDVGSEKTIIEWSFDVLQDDGTDTNQLIATGVDVTVQYRESEKLSYPALHDPLTGLPNRNLFMDRLKTALAQYKRNDGAFCLLYLDLDKFKHINDNLGHEAGDFVLKAIAEILQKILRATDTVARLGGDEFGIILTNIKTHNDATVVAQKCIDAISQPFKYLTHQLKVGASIGIAYYPDYNCDLIQLIKHADTAMYEVKKTGRNAFCFYVHDKADNKIT